MRETKIKKRFFGLFLIPLVLALLTILSINSSTPVHAATVVDPGGGGGGQSCNNPEIIYWFSSETAKNTIHQATVGTNADGSACKIYPIDYGKETADFHKYKAGYKTGSNDYTSCTNIITVNTPAASGATTGTFDTYTKKAGSTICSSNNDDTSISIYKDEASATAAAKSANDDGGSGSTDNKTSCSIPSIGWLLCPVINFGANIADAALGFISDSFLKVDTSVYNTGSGTFQAWQGILTFANVIFVIAFLIIIFAQATGFGISNYGIKKMLPRLIVGAVLINISFFICQLAVDASNLLGYGFDGFFDNIAKSVGGGGGDDFFSKGNTFTDIAGAILTSTAAIAAIVAALAFFTPVILAALVALLLIFLILVARQAIIVLAIVTAPLAFAAWLLPNTEKLFKQWWGIFSKMLLLFPIIALVFGVCKLLSQILMTAYSGNGAVAGNLQAASTVSADHPNLIGEIMAAAVLTVPLFAVPFLLKGALDSVPVVGKVASRMYGGAVGGTRKRAKAQSDVLFGGLQAQKRAGVRGMFGQNRALRDNEGNIMYDRQGRMLGKNGQPLGRTVRQAWAETQRSFDDNKKSYEKVADENYKARALNEPSTVAGRALRREEQQGVRGAATASGFDAELSDEKRNTASSVGQWERRRLENADVKKDFDTQTTNAYEASILQNANSRGGRARRSAEQQNVRAAALSSGFEAELAAEKRDTSTLAGQYERTRMENAEIKKAADTQTTNAFEASLLNNPGSVAGQARRVTQREGVISARTAAGFENELSEERVTNPGLREIDQETQALGLSTRTAQNERLGRFARDLGGADPTLLNIAQGNVDPDKGRRIATAYATDAIQAERKKNIEAQKVLVRTQIRQDAVQSGQPELKLLAQQFKDAAAEHDSEKLSAVGELMLQQGASGYDQLDTSITESGASFVGDGDSETTWRDFSGHMVDVKAGDLKVRRRDTLGTLYMPKYIPEGANAIKFDPATLSTLTAKEKSTQTATSMRQAVSVGGITLTDTRAILLEDGLVQEMSPAQIDAIASTIMKADSIPATKDAARQTAMLIQEGDTYPRFDFELRKKIDEIAGRAAPNFGGKGRLKEDQSDPSKAPTSAEQARGATVPEKGGPAPGPGEGTTSAPTEDNAPFTEGSGFDDDGDDGDD